MVGAGGIGCELLKNLVLLGIPEIHIIDLDTIDLSNLNRQFLFGREHIKKAKAMVAKETASKFNPNVNIVAHHDNIMAEKYNVEWFKGFDIVYNALDNLEARRHVNRICLAAKVPLIESGTAGFNGQVQVIVAGKTECYDCNPKPTTKSFPVCTIRSTPSQPIHCIVWAKSYLFSQLFEAEEEAAPLENTDEAENAEERENMQREANELRELRDGLLNDEQVGKKLVNKVFKTDVDRLLSMESMWKSRKAPTPIEYNDELQKKMDELTASSVLTQDQKVWCLEENLVVLQDSLRRLVTRLKESSEKNPIISFDKDDEDTLDFVVAAANIRSLVFSIETKSKFEVKQIAGNIIPAIATTNAIIAGVCVLQSLKLLQNRLEDARMVFLSRQPERVFSTEKLQPPNPQCVVSGIARVTLKVDPTKFTVGQLVKSALEKDLKYSEELSVVTHSLIYDPDFDDNLDKPLSDFHIKNGSFITVVDEDEETNRVNLELYVQADPEVKDYELIDPPESFPTKPKKPEEPEEDDDASSPEEVVEEPPTSAQKRKLEEANESVGKRPKLDEDTEEDGGIVIIDGSDNDDAGIVEIED
ncbi:hypothetical protein TRICI_001854 [Trichomonascus ciferrii]|uniref:Ubiquitin-activating enzyme E1-like n=1 Tax=Trichomonascus ciferrii TaxID=44093 RepID=A0A642V8K5_9ASCO|nr:hypothetical protein TRICI_001854 [Trichomonascus ciferrii]